jgi:hypothetical protein
LKKNERKGDIFMVEVKVELKNIKKFDLTLYELSKKIRENNCTKKERKEFKERTEKMKKGLIEKGLICKN